MNQFFDAHTHTHFAAYKDDYRDVIRRALDAGVGLVNVGTQQDTSRRAVEVAHEFANEPVYAAIGLHPIHTAKSYHDESELGGGETAKAFTSRGEEFDYEYYKQLALDPKTVAIGECGLDYYHREGAEAEMKRRQKEALLEQMKLSGDVKKPLMVHCRDAFKDLIDTLTTNYRLLNADNPGIIHFFTGTKDDARKLLDLGFSFTFGGTVTYPPKARIHPDNAFRREIPLGSGEERNDEAVLGKQIQQGEMTTPQPNRGDRSGKDIGGMDSMMPDYRALVEYLPLDRILSETDAPYVAPVPHRGKRNEPVYVVETVKKLAEIKGIPLDEMADAIWKNALCVFQLN